jgi:signal transduction histidine kinase
LFSALAAVSPRQTAAEIEMLAALAALQVVAPRVPKLSTRRGTVATTGMKLALGFLLIGVTGGILSSYYPILIVPVVSAATTLGPWATTVTTALACLAYLAFLPLAASFGFPLEPNAVRESVLRLLFLPLIAFLTYQLASDNREQARRAQRTADELAEANRRLQEAEASVRRSDRLAALGQLTAGLAHELRNPLGTIRVSSEMLRQRIGVGDSIAEELAGYIASEVDRTNNLIGRFLEFARPVRLKKESADLNAVADRAIENLVRERPEAASQIHKNYSPDIPTVQGDGELLERVVFNLVRNALEASPAGATVTIKTRHTPEAVEVAVLDRGSGVPADQIEQIFNPFFTTKSDGIGLGLAISAKIAAEHGGRIKVESEMGKGSIFVLEVPRSGGPSSPQSM